MKAMSILQTQGARGFYRPSGCVSAGQLADLITDALRCARDEGLRDVLINITGISGFESPGPAYRRWVASRWAQTAAGTLTVAVVASREHICPQRTGLLVAAEEGLKAHICEVEAAAIAWLDGATESRSTI